jgi:hypothetical protein
MWAFSSLCMNLASTVFEVSGGTREGTLAIHPWQASSARFGDELSQALAPRFVSP